MKAPSRKGTTRVTLVALILLGVALVRHSLQVPLAPTNKEHQAVSAVASASEKEQASLFLAPHHTLDSSSSSWWQSMNRFRLVDLTVDTHVLGVKTSHADHPEDIYQTRDYLDFSVEHVSRNEKCMYVSQE